MCQIVVIKNSKKLDREFLLEQYSRNRDGIGFCYFKDGRWHWKKFLDFEQFYNFYLNCSYQRAIIHFRMGTSGSKDLSNVHPFLISKKRRIDLEEGVLEDGEILFMQNGVTNEIFTIAKFLLLEDLKKQDFSDTKTIAYLFKRLNIFDIREIALRIKMIDNISRFVLITNKKVTMLGNFTEYTRDVFLSNGCYRYGLYSYTNTNKKRLNCSSRIEKIISEKLNTDYVKTNLRFDFDTNLFELEAEREKFVFGFRGLKRFLRRIGVEEEKIKEIIKELKEEIKKEKEKKEKKEEKNKRDNYSYYYDLYYDYYYYNDNNYWR